MAIIVLYDGGCPMCQREISFYQRIAKQADIVWCNIVNDHSILKRYGITFDDAMMKLHVIDQSGSVHLGVDGFICLWRVVPYFTLLSFILRCPGIYSLAKWSYGYFARWRFAKRFKK